jgi:hypothetical protein
MVKTNLTITSLLQSAYSAIQQPASESTKRRTIEEILNVESVKKAFKQIETWFESKSKIELNPERILALVIFFTNEENENLKYDTLCKNLGLSSNLELLKLTDSIKYFQKEGILVVHRYYRSSQKRTNSLISNYFIENNFLTALVQNQFTKYNNETRKLSEVQFIRKVVSITKEMDMESSCTTKEGLQNLILVIHANKELPLVQKLIDMFGDVEFGQENESDLVFPIVNHLICVTLISKSFGLTEPIDFIREFEDILGNITLSLCELIENESHCLIKQGFIKIAPSLMREKMALIIEINPELQEYFVPNLITKPELNKFRFIKKIDISDTGSEFFYPKSLAKELGFLQDLFQLNDLPQNLKVFIWGPSGTGKTSFVKHLAKLSGRSIFISKEVKSKWFGESQSQLSQMFDEIESVYSNQKNIKCPIFFIDEADGLLANRTADTGSGSYQTEYEIQTLLLQRIESYKGILICCSNYPISFLDDAFNRRFDLILEMQTDYDSKYKMLKQRIVQEGIDIEDYEILELAKNETLTPALIDLLFKKAFLYKRVNREFDFISEAKSRMKSQDLIKQVKGFRIGDSYHLN